MDNEDILRPYVVFDFDAHLSIVEAADFHIAEGNFQNLSDLFCQCSIGVARKDDHILSM